MKISKKVRWVLLISAVVATTVFWQIGSHKLDKKTIQDIDIQLIHDNEVGMLQKADVLAHLDKSDVVWKNISVGNLDLNYVENALNKMPFIEKSDVYLDYNGTLNLRVYERQPILRIIPQNGKSHYIDQGGKSFPLSETYAADVPVATGNIDSAMSSKLYTLARYVQESVLWSRSIEQIFVTDRGEISFLSKLGTHQVVLGDIDRLDAKFKKLEEFYQKAMKNVGWDKYTVVDLQYKDQVICK
jgi:cell division protein FtsQ